MFNLTTASQISGNVRTRLLDVDLSSPITLITVSSKSGDGTWEIFIDKYINNLEIPDQPTLAKATTGGNIPRDTKIYVRITTIDANGLEGTPSLGNKFIIVTSTTDTNKVTVSWSTVTGAASYNIYASTRPGMLGLIGNTASLSYILTDVPQDVVGGLTSAPDIIIYGKKGGTEPIPIVNNLWINTNIIVYVTTSAASEVGLSMILG